ncbi:hypothetical protein WR25_14492 isoform B [Diploscapter pachys]|uniref:BPTI/Kunitz inhibitor domain-containing protein n=1 Tax=Diploscapter pachys TaxID=2018661 RepID=A0A2A2J358_9BILA|nr:hypothetical protein WR25_14492 isoform A [Diploscapter pachys]PAV55963.1 hypothetical protein WR25_14492 isoform B [Diploscapter pachys]
MFCNSGLCSCLSSYIAAESYCYQKIEPGQPGCVYNEQCSSVWPDAFCDTSAGVGTCRCGEHKVERPTRDGHVCLDVLDANHNTLAITCPLPEGAGYTSALSDPKHPRQSDGPGPVLCNTESSLTHQSAEDVGDGNAACIFPSDGQYIADLYDCVEFVSTMDLTTSGYSEKADGICSFTCVQPTATGPNPTEPRWWYNSITGMCQQFLWDPTATGPGEHSPNNFRTVEHCESYCRDSCARAAPEYEHRSTLLEETPITGCSQATTCSNNYECKTVGSAQWCCPTVASICGVVGGRPQDLSIHHRSTVFHPGVEKQGTASSTRFFYDPQSGKCSPFTFLGAGGNYNNFLSRIDCELYCARLQCDRGNPLRIGDVTQSCQSNSDCPSSHECKADQGVCCPKMQTICTQPLRVGNCDRSVRRYWYSAATRECQSFEYTGCQGNDNNFETLVDCQTFCRNATPEPRCLQGQAYKDNQGKFVTCSPNRQASSCPANFECFFDGSLHACCPTKTFTCSLSPNPGKTCGPGISFKYYYNSQTQECESFEYLGCDGNSNNFASRTECETFCGVGGCANGGVPLRDSSGALQTCSEKEGGCPSTHECTTVSLGADIISHRCCPTKTYICGLPPQQGSSLCSGGLTVVTRYYFNICIYDGLTDQSVCCGATDMGVCPDGEKAYISAVDTSVRECLINEHNSCPKDYLCRFNPVKNRYFCCGSINKNYCPMGRAPYKDQMTLYPMRCTMHATASGCADGFECMSDVKSALQGYCCSVSDICPHKEEYFVDESSGMPRSCTIGHFVACPAGYSCMAQFDGLVGYCCRGQPQMSASDGCPPGQVSYFERNEVVSCDPFNLAVNQGCPPTFSCQWSVRMQRYQCCGADPLPPPIETGYFCQFSTQNKQFQCCGIPSDCPTDMVAFVGISGEAQACSMNGGSACPEGFACVKGKTGLELCCAGGEVCDASEVSVNGVCMPKRAVGLSCEDTVQCQGDSTCERGICKCPKKTKEIAQQCIPLDDPRCGDRHVKIANECFPMVSLGRSCVHSAQCMGMGACIDGVCDCPKNTQRKGDRCDPKTRSTGERHTLPVPLGPIKQIQPPVKITIGKDLNEGLCTSPRVPYLTNGIARQCILGQTCPVGYTCTFSKQAQNYFCCSGVAMKTGAIAKDFCLGGEALMFPSTNTPVVCNRYHRCPPGYYCKRNRKSMQHYCCSKAEQIPMETYISQVGMSLRNAIKEIAKKKTELAQQFATFRMPPRKKKRPEKKQELIKPTSKISPCPSYLYLLEVEVHHKQIRRCQSTCPNGMIPVKGICRVQRRQPKN